MRERRPSVEYRLPDGTFPGEAVLREMLGNARVDELLYGRGGEGDDSAPGAARPRLRLVR